MEPQLFRCDENFLHMACSSAVAGQFFGSGGNSSWVGVAHFNFLRLQKFEVEHIRVSTMWRAEAEFSSVRRAQHVGGHRLLKAW